MPKPRLGDWPDRPGGRNRSTGQDNGPRAALAPGDEAGLVQFGAQPERLPPGSRSSHRHWHEAEDELVFVLSGELVLVEDTETVLRAGDAAARAAPPPSSTVSCPDPCVDRAVRARTGGRERRLAPSRRSRPVAAPASAFATRGKPGCCGPSSTSHARHLFCPLCGKLADAS